MKSNSSFSGGSCTVLSNFASSSISAARSSSPTSTQSPSQPSPMSGLLVSERIIPSSWPRRRASLPTAHTDINPRSLAATCTRVAPTIASISL